MLPMRRPEDPTKELPKKLKTESTKQLVAKEEAEKMNPREFAAVDLQVVSQSRLLDSMLDSMLGLENA